MFYYFITNEFTYKILIVFENREKLNLIIPNIILKYYPQLLNILRDVDHTDKIKHKSNEIALIRLSWKYIRMKE